MYKYIFVSTNKKIIWKEQSQKHLPLFFLPLAFNAEKLSLFPILYKSNSYNGL